MRTFLEKYRGKNASIYDFEQLTNQIAGKPMRYFFARWVDSTGVPEFKVDYQIIRTRGGKFIARGTVKQNYDNLNLPVEVQAALRRRRRFADVRRSISKTRARISISNRTASRSRSSSIPDFKLLRISDRTAHFFDCAARHRAV